MNQKFGYKKGPFVALILVATIVIVMGIYFAVVSPQKDSGAVATIFTLIGCANVLMAVVLMSKKISVSNDAIASSTLFSSTRISFQDFKAVLVERRRTKGGSVEVIIIKGPNSTISFSETLSGYDRLKSIVTSHADSASMDEGANVLAPELERKTIKQLKCILSVCFLILAALAGWIYKSADDKLARYALMDRVGRHTMGRVTNWYTSGSKSRSYNLEFSYSVNGKEFHHSSPVSSTRYYSTHRGEQVTLIYVPNDPDTCRMTDSVGPEMAESQRVGAFVFVAVDSLMVGLAYFAAISSMRKTALQNARLRSKMDG